jgi:hypothetical protein
VSGKVPVTAPLAFAANDHIDIGSDLGSPVSLEYFDAACGSSKCHPGEKLDPRPSSVTRKAGTPLPSFVLDLLGMLEYEVRQPSYSDDEDHRARAWIELYHLHRNFLPLFGQPEFLSSVKDVFGPRGNSCPSPKSYPLIEMSQLEEHRCEIRIRT